MNLWMEILAYCASIIVLISFCIKDVMLLRLMNNIGCVLFIIYSWYYGRIPLVIMNFLVIVINFYYIFKNKKKENAK